MVVKLGVLACVCIGFGQAAAPPRGPAIPGPAAVATNADVNYCFARVRGLDPGRLPPAYLVVQLRIRVAYRNAGPRPLILPMEHERNIYTSLKPGVMTRLPSSLLDPSYKPMKSLPADVNADDPTNPKNDVFAVIPTGREIEQIEEITLPVNRRSLFRTYPDLRGKKVYIRLEFKHRELTDALAAKLSDRWARFGVPWTGLLMTNAFTIDVPANPHAAPCKDNYTTVAVEPPLTGK